MAELALFGGDRTVRAACPVGRGWRSDEAAIQAVRRWLAGADGSSLSGGGAIAELEGRFRALTARRYAIAVSSGTAALLVGLRASGVGHGDAVLVPSYDWPAAAAATLALGARPVPVDVEIGSGTLDARSLVERATPDCRAVVVTHLGGRAADLGPILAAARARGLAIIEDCAQALGATYGGRPVGSFGDAGAFSLGPNKLLSAGEGGVVVTDDERLYEAAIRWSQHPLYQRLRGVEPDSLHLNFRMHPIAAALALARMEEAVERLACIRANAVHWTRVFEGRPGFILPDLQAGAEPSWWAYAVRHDAAAWGVPLEVCLTALHAEGVPVAPGPVARTLCWTLRRAESDEDGCCPGAETWRATALQLPCPDADPALFGAFTRQVATALDKTWARRESLRGLWLGSVPVGAQKRGRRRTSRYGDKCGAKRMQALPSGARRRA